jgi:hypothetical protein
MSESENGSEEQENNNNDSIQMVLVKHIQKYPEIISKSQLPQVVHKKNGALEELIKIYENHTGKPTTNKKIMKMINNMKTRLKKNIDTKRTGNKKIIMKEYERIILKVMNGEQNPIITQIPGK